MLVTLNIFTCLLLFLTTELSDAWKGGKHTCEQNQIIRGYEVTSNSKRSGGKAVPLGWPGVCGAAPWGRRCKPVWKRRRSGQISDAGAPPAASPEHTFQHFSLIALLVQLQMEQSVAAVFRSRALLCITKKIELRLEQRDSTRFTTASQSVWRSKTGELCRCDQGTEL